MRRLALVYYIDEIMGRGKTSAMINYINACEEDRRFLFITPLLGEDERICRACASKSFQQPSSDDMPKREDIKRLISEGANIASTHSLFTRLDDEALGLLEQQHYTLIMDETMCVISTFEISPYDASNIMKNYADVDESGFIRWREDLYSGKYDEYRTRINAGGIIAYNEYHWVQVMSPTTFNSFQDVFIMTYLFQDQIIRCYLDMNNIPYERRYVNGSSQEDYTISDRYEPAPVQDFRKLLHITEHKKLNAVGDDYYALSKGWYRKHSNPSSIKKLKNNTYNFYRNIIKTSGKSNIWTCFQDEKDERGVPYIRWKDMLSDPLYKAGFVPCNAKGTNDFRHKTSLAYLVNIFPNTNVMCFLSANGVPLDRDRYALSEMIQWIWRSAIRDGKEVTLYIPSRRMRTLLTDWMNEVCGGGEKI